MLPNKTFVSPKMIYGSGALTKLPQILIDEGVGNKVIYFIDYFFENKNIEEKLDLTGSELIFYVDTKDEPKTDDIDNLVRTITNKVDYKPDVIVGIGGGSVMDVAKAVSVMLTNSGSSQDYQGWDLVKNEGVYKIGIPTISGTGSEVSRTTVLSGASKKQGINSLKSMFDFVILDPSLLKTVPITQRFYTGMDCYIHSVEAICGGFINNFSHAYADKALILCEEIFLGDKGDGDLMIASMFGGYSIVYSEVGVCHALSYGISLAFGIHHGEANCIVFDYLDDYYPKHVPVFRQMLKKHSIKLKRGLTKNIKEETLESMVEATLLMEKPLHNALGSQWREVFTSEKIKNLFLRM
jgi:3-deoxy-alpha-D-manno-octulosonate 8-oxidase